MKKAGGGKIVNIGSMASYIGGPRWTAYGPAKAGIVQLSKNCASAWAKDNIQVNSIWLGLIDTALTKPMQANNELMARVNPRIAGGRDGKPTASLFPTLRGLPPRVSCAVRLAAATVTRPGVRIVVSCSRRGPRLRHVLVTCSRER